MRKVPLRKQILEMKEKLSEMFSRLHSGTGLRVASRGRGYCPSLTTDPSEGMRLHPSSSRTTGMHLGTPPRNTSAALLTLGCNLRSTVFLLTWDGTF
ncbi:hypothetical protein TNIN_121841 [Trichonephila inaurata madagascariensis]|uniref:Uncharacterized protein n=1 Tax=Trichonephila inaurata madagascariensis TaxID=2747483 RepID=A0A8X6WSH6_9ARAC|nr:hypothetical protein TNIN_121841 [Trichonephila inaurata madagascariensis]